MKSRSLVFWGAVLTSLGFGQFATAQSYPDRPIRMYIGYSAGGGTDVVGRLLASKLSEKWGQPVIVENRPGADGTIANAVTAKATNDGYTINMITSSFTIAPFERKVSFDPVKDFAPVTQVAVNPNLLVVNITLPVRTVKELIALAKSKPGALSAGSSGTGGPYFATQLFKSMAGIDIVNVPYKGSSQAVVDLVAGRVQVMFGSISSTLPQVESGKLRALAVSSRKRNPRVPNLPTVEEAGNLRGFEYATWYGLLAPAGTSSQIVSKLHIAIVESLKLADVRTVLEKGGFDVIGNTPAEFAEVIKADLAKWKPIVTENAKTK